MADDDVPSLLKRTGKVAMGVSIAAGRGASKAFAAVDPALRQHFAEMSLTGLTYAAQRQTPALDLDEGEAGCVIFVHGLGGHRGNFVPMQRYFRYRGVNNGVSLGFDDATSIEAMAHELSALIMDIAERDHIAARGTTIVAHSMGGIIARAALLDHDVAHHVRRVVTLGTPHHGTQLARLLATKKVRDLRPDSPLLARLAAQLPWRASTEVPELICFWSRRDLVMMPPESAVVEGAIAIERGDCSHNGFLLRPRALRAVFDAATRPLG